MRDGVLSVVKSGKEYEWEWKVEHFYVTGVGYWSPDFRFEGKSWYFFLNPYCNGYLQLNLWRLSGGSPMEVEFSVSVKTTEGTKSFERRDRYRFKELHSCYTIRKWIKCHEFSKPDWIYFKERRNRETKLLSSDCLTILITMKRVDSRESETARSESKCSCCKERLHEEKVSFHKECLNKEAKCPRCDKMVNLQNWFDHVCQTENGPGENDVSQTSMSQPKEKTLQDLKKLFFNQENFDVVLRVQGQEFSAHQAILTARSPVFASTFRNNMKEKETGIVDIEDIDPSCFREFLCFLYCGEIDKLSAENVHSLFIAADKYEVTDLRTMCIQFMKENLTVNEFCKTLVLALLHTETELIDSCIDYFIRNAEEIIKSVQWQNFVVENPIQGNELFLKYVKSSKKSNK